jgi:hypothetical protein
VTRQGGKLDEVWLFMGVQKSTGKEFFCGMMAGTSGPAELMLSGDRKGIESWLPYIRHLAKDDADTYEIRLVRFSQRTDMETIKP